MEHFIIDNYIEMFGRLEELYIRPGFLPLKQLLAAASHLRKLKIHTDDNFDLDLKGVSLPNLLSLHLLLFNCGGIERFLIRHPRIEIFAFQMPLPINSDRHHYQTNHLIYKFLPNIRQIEVYHDEKKLLSKMKNLKSVELILGRYVTPTINEFLVQNTPIEEMELYDVKFDSDTIESICKIKTIKEIYFTDCTGFDSNKFIQLVERLPNLKNISCSMNDPAEFLEEILPILKNKCIEWFDATDGECGSYDPKNDVVHIINNVH